MRNDTTMRIPKVLVNKLKLLMDVRGRNESLSDIVSSLVVAEEEQYLYCVSGLLKIGDKIYVSNAERETCSVPKTIIAIEGDDVFLDDKTIMSKSGRLMYWSELASRGDR